MELKKYTNKAGMQKAPRTIPHVLGNVAGPLSGLQCNVLASLVHFVTYTTKRTRDASALHWRPERGPALFHSAWGRVLGAFCISTLFAYIFQLHPYSKGT